MALRSRTCPECGASVPRRTEQCPYCGTWFEAAAKNMSSAAPVEIVPAPSLHPEAGAFGVQSRGFLVGGLCGALVLYLIGWFFEDPEYWLADAAIWMWAVAEPAWLFLIALGLQTRRGVILSGVAFAVVQFAVHLAVIGVIAGRVQDDYVGIAAMFAGAALGGWLLGRMLHRIIRPSRAQTAP